MPWKAHNFVKRHRKVETKASMRTWVPERVVSQQVFLKCPFQLCIVVGKVDAAVCLASQGFSGQTNFWRSDFRPTRTWMHSCQCCPVRGVDRPGGVQEHNQRVTGLVQCVAVANPAIMGVQEGVVGYGVPSASPANVAARPKRRARPHACSYLSVSCLLTMSTFARFPAPPLTSLFSLA